MIKAEIFITLKKTVADPQGQTVKHALESLGYHQLERVGMGKLITVDLDTDNRAKAEKDLDEMCKKLLANPVIEDYRFSLSGGPAKSAKKPVKKKAPVPAARKVSRAAKAKPAKKRTQKPAKRSAKRRKK